MNNLLHLRDCKKISLITDLNTGEIVCSHCGAVVPEKSIDESAESSHVSAEEYMNNSRTGQKISLKMADMGLSTIIESKDRDSTGRSLSTENKRMFYRLRMWDRNSRFANTNQSYMKAFTLLDGLKAKLGLSDAVVEQTAYLFRKIALKKILAGRSTVGMICATVYIACRLTNTPRTIQDVASAGNIKRKQLQSIYRFLLQQLDIYPESYSPTEFVTRISNESNVSEKTKRYAMKILAKSQKIGITTSKNPMAMAAAALYIASLRNRENISQTRISEISGISSVTIRDRAKEINDNLGDGI
ncbi:MAG: transcription factor TFIIB [Nitrosopumilus sp.]|nr:MAG: transcription factor TFIIB [Nitrosopumilus sp.]